MYNILKLKIHTFSVIVNMVCILVLIRWNTAIYSLFLLHVYYRSNKMWLAFKTINHYYFYMQKKCDVCTISFPKLFGSQ